jgi:CHAT domain-containing protein
MEANVQPVAEAILPPATRAFIAPAKRLIFSPHRALHLVPLHAARFDGRFLIEHAAIRYIPNLGSLLLPWHGTDDGTVASIGINNFGRGLRPLKTAEAEAQAVAEAWAGKAVTTALIGPAATRAAFTGLDLAACRCLHLATHGQSVYSTALQGDPFASRLCFADGDLEAMSLAELPLRAALVVMSACHSGQRALALPGGRELPGDDLFGLQATLFQAGVRSVIGALWTVDDASAPKILPALHRGLASGAPPEQALQAAVCAYLNAPGAKRAIYFWAPLFMSSIGRLQRSSPGATT